MKSYSVTTYDDLEKTIAKDLLEQTDGKLTGRMIGLVFMQKGQEIVEREILPSMDVFDARSAGHINFYFPGWERTQHYGLGIDGTPRWEFNAQNFVKACAVISSESNWSYSGGIDLLLFATTKNAEGGVIIDLRGIIVLRILELRNDKLVPSVGALFEQIFSFAEKYEGGDMLGAYMRQEARVSFISALIDLLLSKLPKEVRDNINYAKSFQIKDVSKEGVGATAGFKKLERRSGDPRAL